MAKITHNFSEGDSVKVKPGVQDPDLGGDIGGWVGRITEIDQDTVDIEWDSLTLAKMPVSIISQCEQDGLDWSVMGLYPTDIEHTEPRDTPADVERVLRRLQTEHQWDHLGKEGSRIQQVLQEVDPDDELAADEAWGRHLEQVLKFSFEAEVAELQERGQLRQGDKVKVLEIASVEDLYGVIVTVSHGQRRCQFPLCDLEVTRKTSPNYRPVKDYAVWFANR